MPTALTVDDDDPVIASYDVFFTGSPKNSNSQSKLLVLQYPAHRPRFRPYNAATSQKPNLMRMKAHTGMVEIEVPILDDENYHPGLGRKFGQALSDSRDASGSGSHGLARGFSSGLGPGQTINLHSIPQHDQDEEKSLDHQTLGGKLVGASKRDPVYMLGIFRDNELHLSHSDGVIQMRPQLHHIDAEEEANQKKFHSVTAAARIKPGFELGPTRLETKAIELKLKDNKEDTKDRNLNENARLLRDIQRDEWDEFAWVDEREEAAISRMHETAVLSHDPDKARQLRSLLSNDDWLDKMSVPREDGKKGLRSKLKGRDRERARRKKVEHQRRLASAANPTTTVEAIFEDSDSSGHSDVEVVEPTTGLGEEDIKQEPGGLATAPERVSNVPNPVAAAASSPPKKRGRPRKEVVSVD